MNSPGHDVNVGCATVILSLGQAEMLCGMFHAATVSISENVVYGHKETGVNYSGETGCACKKPETFVCSETLNLPGGQHQTHGGSQGVDVAKPPHWIRE